MHIQSNSKRATAQPRPHLPFHSRPLPLRLVRRPEAREEGLTTEQLRRIVIAQIG